MSDKVIDGEGRVSRRHRTLKTGKLWFDKFKSVIDCQVRDMSQTGARVRFETTFPCPEQVVLYFPVDNNEGNLRRCETKWVQGNDAGLFYTSKPRRTLITDVSKRSLPNTW